MTPAQHIADIAGYVQYVLVAIFLAKIAFNFICPYILAYQVINRGRENVSYGMCPIEVVILIAAFTISLIATGPMMIHDPKIVGLAGVILIVASAIHFVVVAAIFAIIRRLSGTGFQPVGAAPDKQSHPTETGDAPPTG